MDKKLLQDCPVCGTLLRVRVLQCPACHTRIEGDFTPATSRILTLSGKELEFVERFVSLRGNIREMEKALSVSYPTVRSMLDNIILKLGYPVQQDMDKKEKTEIIGRLERGEITAEEAERILSGGNDAEEEENDE